MDWYQVVEGEPAGVLIGDGDGKLTYLNPAAARLLGGDRSESLTGRPVAELLAGHPAAATASRVLPTGESVWYLSADALSAREEALFAAEVSDALAGDLNVRRTLGHIADLVVPRLGTWASLTLLDNDRIRRVSRGPGAAVDDRVLPLVRLEEAGRRRFQQALDSDYEEIEVAEPAELCHLGAPPEVARSLLARGPVPVVTATLRSHGAVLGLLAVCPDSDGARGGIQGLARRAAVAINAARVYEERSTLASTLRSALLPTDLPAPPGLGVGSVYRPALETTEIGGDFYEMGEDGPGWSFSIGDVCGKGVEAAVRTGQVRHSLGTVALVSTDPAERLRLLNSALLRADGTSFVTLVHGILRREADTVAVRMAAGGHPAPLLLHRDGLVEEVAVGGPIVGMLPEVTFRSTDVRLEPEETLVCFTDGLPDARGADGLYGVERLARVLTDSRGMTAQVIAERMLQSALEHLDGRPHDDMAILAVQMEAAAPAGP